MKENEQDRLKKLLRQALPPVDTGTAGEPEPAGDLWPAVLKRLDAPPSHVPWFDWALIAGIAAAAAIFPSTIPVLLYYL
jgi:hypothetical protein